MIAMGIPAAARQTVHPKEATLRREKMGVAESDDVDARKRLANA